MSTKITITETGEVKELSITTTGDTGYDGCDWSGDLLGNAGLRSDPHDDTIHMSAADYHWWLTYIDGQERIQAARKGLTDDEQGELRRRYPGVDMEDEAACVLALIGEIKARRTMTLDDIETKRKQHEGELVKRQLHANGWRLRPTAEALGISTGKLTRLIRDCGLEAEYGERNPGQGRPTMCHHCKISGSTPAGEATISAAWVDADGLTDGIERRVCRECYDAGSPTGPGYRKA